MECRGEPSDFRDALIRDGFAVIPKLFTADEIAQLRGTIHRHLKQRRAGSPSSFGRVEPLAALEIPELLPLLADPRILDSVRNLLNTATPEFLLHCDAHLNDRSSWHKDTGESVFPDGYFGRPIFDYDECIVVKLAIYCEDHLHDDDGLHVRPGTHRIASIEDGMEVTIPTTIGDVVAFDVRVTHMGSRRQARHRRIEGVTKLAPARLQSRVGRILESSEAKLFPRSDRTSIFFSFAAKGIETELSRTFAQRNWERGCRQSKREIPVPEEFVEALSSVGLVVATS